MTSTTQTTTHHGTTAQHHGPPHAPTSVFLEMWSRHLLPFFSASLLSFIFSLIMLYRIRRLMRGQPAKLMVRQLQYLALSDAIASFFLGIFCLLPILQYTMFRTGIAGFTQPALNQLCVGMRWSSRMGHQVSRLVEAHIAVACLACTCRWTRLLDCLCYSLVAVWPIGVVLAANVVVKSGWHWDTENEGCSWGLRDGAIVDSICIIVVCIICIGAYFISSVKAKSSPLAAQRRVLDRTGLYILAAIGTFGPYVVWSFTPDGAFTPTPDHPHHPPYHPSDDPSYLSTTTSGLPFFGAGPHPPHHPGKPGGPGDGGNPGAFFFISWTLLELNGAVNAAVYAIQSRHLWRRRPRPTLGSPRLSCGDPNIVGSEPGTLSTGAELTATSSPSTSPALEQGSFRVGFVDTVSVENFSFRSDSGSFSRVGARTEREETLWDALDKAYEANDLEDLDDLELTQGASTSRVPRWRQRMERTGRIRRARQTAIAAYHEEQRAGQSRWCGLLSRGTVSSEVQATSPVS